MEVKELIKHLLEFESNDTVNISDDKVLEIFTKTGSSFVIRVNDED